MADAPKPSLRASLLAICGVLLLVGIVAGSRQRCGARSAVPASRALAQHGLCKPFEQLWEETDPKPQLSKEQMGWISTELYAAGLGRGLSTNLLVFGLGELRQRAPPAAALFARAACTGAAPMPAARRPPYDPPALCWRCHVEVRRPASGQGALSHRQARALAQGKFQVESTPCRPRRDGLHPLAAHKLPRPGGVP